MLRHSNPMFWLLAAFLFAQPAAGQYKSTMPDGSTKYGDAPEPGAVKVEKMKLDTSDKGVRPPVAREAAALKQMEAERKGREAPDRRQQLQEALRRAEADLAAGKEPLPGERIGTAGGGSRLTEAYFARQKQLEAAVEQARRSLEEPNNAGGAPQGFGGLQPGFGTPPTGKK